MHPEWNWCIPPDQLLQLTSILIGADLDRKRIPHGVHFLTVVDKDATDLDSRHVIMVEISGKSNQRNRTRLAVVSHV